MTTDVDIDDTSRQTVEQMSDDELTTLMLEKDIDSTMLNKKNRRHVVNAILRDGKVGTREPLLPNARIVGLRLERDVLQTRITQRVDQMFEQGFREWIKSRLLHAVILGLATADRVAEAIWPVLESQAPCG